MDRLQIKGGVPLHGEIRIDGAKNAALPILAASILATEPVILMNVPHLRDTSTMINLLAQMGASIKFCERESVQVNASQMNDFTAPYDLVRTMRASILVLGPLLARFHQAKVSMPGGCAIGTRPIDLHLMALEAMGATISMQNGYIEAKSDGRLHGAEIHFPMVSVGATENALSAAVLADGKTTLHNVAREPEIVDLANFLNHLGAKIEGAGTDTIVVEGVKALSGGEYRIISDRIEAGTYLIAAAMTQGDVQIKNIKPSLLLSVLDKLMMLGANVLAGDDHIHLSMSKRPKAIDVVTEAYPGFPTDMQAQMMSLLSIAEGESHLTETIFENRFMHVQELNRMGARIRLQDNMAYCEGAEKLSGAPVMATDLRASASLILAGLVAEGETLINRVYHIDRGYPRVEEKLSQLGARVKRLG
ncbi:MAG: UDP-N-acetylglucosamine 1-carboxyvinyltransferase [Legionellaceae bacterium]|nr:UDP-N-acetylglucosamine 1-carboxyvinyltransferase [Legionellaceae bacterium]|tara:strand:- start:81 stop:1337 length:1257 start_codon:yes stop_codon:yes gene_type:complete